MQIIIDKRPHNIGLMFFNIICIASGRSIPYAEFQSMKEAEQ